MASVLSMITKLSRFTTDAGKSRFLCHALSAAILPSHQPNASSHLATAGLEKSLRLLQGLSQIVIAYTTSPIDAAPWLQARKQFALGRRYLRFFKFVDAFAMASRWFNSSSGITAVLGVGKCSCLGMYLLLESCTIIDAMEIYHIAWAPTALLEANKFWFYSLLFSLASCLLQLYRLGLASARSGTPPARGRSKRADSNTLPRTLFKQVLTDVCDLLIPGSITGWARTSPAVVGVAIVAGTLLASEEIWYRVQRAAAAADGKATGKESQVKRKGRV